MAVLAYLLLVASAPPLHSDTARDFLIARDCLAGRTCLGAPTSFIGLYQGDGWVKLLAALHVLGFWPTGVDRLLAGVDALCASVVYFSVSRRFGRAAGAWSAVAFAVLLVRFVGYPVLWNPSLLPLGLVLLHVGLSRSTGTGSVRWGAVAGLGLAVAIEGHVAMIGLVPLAAASLWVASPRPRASVAVALAVPVASALLLSRFSWQVNARVLREPAVAIVVIVVVAAVAGAARSARRRWLTAAPEARGLLAATLPAAIYTLALLAAATFSRHQLAWRYMAPLLVPLALAIGWLAARLIRKRSAWRWCLVVPLSALAAKDVAAGRLGPYARQSYDFHQVRTLATTLEPDGKGYSRLFWHLRGPERWNLLSGLAVYAAGPGLEPYQPTPDLRLVPAGPGMTASIAGFRRIPLGSGRAVFTGPIDTWIDMSQVDACFARAAGLSRCVRIDTRAPAPRTRFVDLAYPWLDGLRRAFLRVRESKGGPLEFTQRFALHVTGGDPAHVVETLHRPTSVQSAWQVAAVDGVAHRGAVPGPCVMLTRKAADRGHITFSEEVQTDVPEMFFASWFETLESESAVRADVRRLPFLIAWHAKEKKSRTCRF